MNKLSNSTRKTIHEFLDKYNRLHEEKRILSNIVQFCINPKENFGGF